MRNAALTGGACLTGSAAGYALRSAPGELAIFLLILALVFGVLSYIASETDKENRP